MNLRLANLNDLPNLKIVYEKIIDHMDKSNIRIWDEIYPCEFFGDDIENNRLYVLENNKEIASAFALCNSNAGADYVKWENNHDNALYIDRLGVNVKYLRLFVVDINYPAINLYIKNGFKKVDGIFDEIIDDDLVFHEFGFEIKTSM